jgi:SRSO17 transposase
MIRDIVQVVMKLLESVGNIGEVGKTDNGVVVVTSHLYDGVKSLPLDVELYQHASSLAGGKADPSFMKKPELALKLVEKSLELG